MLPCAAPLAYAALGGPNVLDARATAHAALSASCPATRLAAAGGRAMEKLHIWGRLGMVGMILARASGGLFASGRHSLVHGMRVLAFAANDSTAHAMERFPGTPSLVLIEDAPVPTTVIWMEE